MCSVPTNPHCSDRKREGWWYPLDRTPSPLISSSVKRAFASSRERPSLLESAAAQTSSRVRTPSLFVSMDSNRASNFPRRGKLLMAEAVKARDGVDGSHPALEKCACCCERLRLTVEALRQKILRWGHSLFLPAAMPLGFDRLMASTKTPSQTLLMGRDEDT